MKQSFASPPMDAAARDRLNYFVKCQDYIFHFNKIQTTIHCQVFVSKDAGRKLIAVIRLVYIFNQLNEQTQKYLQNLEVLEFQVNR